MSTIVLDSEEPRAVAQDLADQLDAAAAVIDGECCCDTVPGDLDVEAVIRESEWGAAFFWVPALAVLLAALTAIWS